MKRPIHGMALAAVTAVAGALISSSAIANGVVVLPPTEINVGVGLEGMAGPGVVNSLTARAYGNVDTGGPYVGVEGSGFAGPENEPSASAKWEVEVTGAAGGVVPIDIIGRYYAATTGSGIASGGVFIGLFNRGGTYLTSFSCQVVTPAGCVDANFTLHSNLSSNTLYTVGITTGGGILGSRFGTFAASIDPTVTIDPGFGDVASYTLHVSPDAIGPSGVPEPALWGLLIVGFGGLGARLRSLRSKRDIQGPSEPRFIRHCT